MTRKPGDARPYRLRDVRERAESMAQLRAWHLFISYARDPDSSVALQLRRYVMRVARPWWGFSNLRVFLDKEAMLPASGLPRQIAGMLSSSSSLVLMANPASASSPWVNEEVGQWMGERGERPLIVVHTGGVLEFDQPDDGGGVNWAATTALNPESFAADQATLRAAQQGESGRQRTFWISDLLPVAERLAVHARAEGPGAAAQAAPSRSGRSPLRQAVGTMWAGARLRRGERAAFRRTALAVVAGVLDLDRDRLSSFERRRRRFSFAVVATVIVSLAALSTATVIEQTRRQHAEELALSRELAAASLAGASSDPDVAALLAVQAYRTSPTAEASSAVIAAASGPLRRILRGHEAAVTSVADAGTIAVTGSDDGTVRVWDTGTGAAVDVLEPGCGAIRQVVVSADARLLLTVCDTAVWSWDLPSGTALHSFEAGSATFTDVVYAPGQDVAVIEGDEGVAWLWRPRTGGPGQRLPGHTGRVTAAALTADGLMLATGDMVGDVRLWDTSTGALEGVLREGTGTEFTGLSFTFISELTFTRDGKRLAVAHNDTSVSLWDVASRSRLHLLQTDGDNGATSVTISPDDRTVATATLDGSVRTWDTATGVLHHTMSVGGFVSSVRFSHDGRNLLTVSDNHTAALWDVQSGTLGASLVGHTDGIRAGEFCPDDSCVVTASADGTARLWTTADVSAHDTYDTQQKDLRALVYDRRGTVLATVANPGPAILLDPHNLASARRLDIGPGGQGIDISPDGTTVATGGDDHLLRLWDSGSGQELSTHTGHTEAISGVYFSPDGSLIATTSYDKTVRLWNARTGDLLHVLPGEWENPWILAFSPTADLLATSYSDEQVQIWDTRSGNLLRRVSSPYPLPNQSNGVKALAFSPDGSLLATSGDDRTICLWDPRTGALIRTMRDATAGIQQVEFSPDGAQIAAAGSEHLARVWDVGTGQPLFVLGGYSDELTNLVYSRDGRLIAVGSYDGTLQFWDGRTGRHLKTIRKDLGFDLSLFSPDGASLTSMSFDGVLRVWEPPPTAEDAVKAVCQAVNRDLTDAEWSRYASGRPEHGACS